MTSAGDVTRRRAALVGLLRRQGIRDARVLAAIGAVPRHEFVPVELSDAAYDDMPLPIGHGQTISQPYIVALMTALAEPHAGDRVLEIGTGCGYQTAVLAELGCDVYSIERIAALGVAADRRLQQLGYRVHTRIADGFDGWPEAAPFDAIIVTAAPLVVPPALQEQMAKGGRMVVPIGSRADVQNLTLVRRLPDGSFRSSPVAPVRFVPMVAGDD